jgi:hypothetical protein
VFSLSGKSTRTDITTAMPGVRAPAPALSMITEDGRTSSFVPGQAADAVRIRDRERSIAIMTILPEPACIDMEQIPAVF